MDDPNRRPDENTQRRARVRDALIRRGLVPAHAETLAKGLVDLVTVIGPEACAEAFAIALEPAAPPAGLTAALAAPAPVDPASTSTPGAEQVLGAFVTELKRLDDALAQLTSQLGRLQKTAVDAGSADRNEKKTLH